MGGRGKELPCEDWVIIQNATARAGLILVQSLCMCRLMEGGVGVEVRGACFTKTGSSLSECCSELVVFWVVLSVLAGVD